MIVPAGGNWNARFPSWFNSRCLLNGDGGPAIQMITIDDAHDGGHDVGHDDDDDNDDLRLDFF